MLMRNCLRSTNEDIFLANLTRLVLPLLGIKSLQHLFSWCTFDLSLLSVAQGHLYAGLIMPLSALMQAMLSPNVCLILSWFWVSFSPDPGLMLPWFLGLILP